MKNPVSIKTGLPVCLCGCQEHVAGRAVYRPGHDARHVSVLFGHLVDILMDQEEDASFSKADIQGQIDGVFRMLPSDKLQQKLGRMVDNDRNGLYNAFADRGLRVPFTTRTAVTEVVKIGRWEYPVRRDNVGVWRNEKRDGSGKWVALG